MSDLKTMPAALAELLRPRRMARVRRTVARSRAEGALFDAGLWTAFSLLVVLVLLVVVDDVSLTFLAARGIDKVWLVAGAMLVGLFGAGALWWRWFKWNLLAVDLSRHARGSQLPADSISPR